MVQRDTAYFISKKLPSTPSPCGRVLRCVGCILSRPLLGFYTEPYSGGIHHYGCSNNTHSSQFNIFKTICCDDGPVFSKYVCFILSDLPRLRDSLNTILA